MDSPKGYVTGLDFSKYSVSGKSSGVDANFPLMENAFQFTSIHSANTYRFVCLCYVMIVIINAVNNLYLLKIFFLNTSVYMVKFAIF